jgi:K(+)-stimulated pyrophosphate-energized sodium pump
MPNRPQSTAATSRGRSAKRPLFASLFALIALLVPTLAFGQGESEIKLIFSQQDYTYLGISLAFAIFSILFGVWLRWRTLALSPGNQKMIDVSSAIREGALAYLAKQRGMIAIFVIVLAAGLYFLYQGNPGYGPAWAAWLAVCFVAGVAASYIAGYVGMGMAVQGNSRTAQAALGSLKGSVEAAFRAGAVSGMFTVGMGLLGATLIFLFAGNQAMMLLIGFGFGGSLAALFMRVGGGIYTKAADVGADLVGKVEAGIPEDDPRNPATIADNVGDNVGDCAGMAADVFESYEVTLVAAIVLGAATRALFPVDDTTWMKMIIFALIARGLGIVASAIGVLGMRGTDSERVDPLASISKGFWLSAAAAIVLTWGFAWYYMSDITITLPRTATEVVVEWWRFALAVTFGVLMAYAIERLTDYYVSTERRPVKEVAGIATTGPATMTIQGFAYGMESSVWSLVAIVVALLAPLFIFPPGQFGGPVLSFYGIALVGLGLLTTTGYILAMDTFGPISDNAQGVFEMSGALHEVEAAGKKAAGGVSPHRIVQRLDSAGNTTKALTKGFAIATAVVAATALFHSFVHDAKLTSFGLPVDVPQIFLGLLIGGASPFLFGAFSINAVGRASFKLINEVRRQFGADPGIMAGTSKPDYGRCVSIVTRAAQQELLSPGILAIALPVLVGFGLAIGAEPVTIGGHSFVLTGAQALGGYLAGAILSGQLLAVLLFNSGGIWDNAKKTIEDGLHGGKGTDAHKAGVVVDTVGDPFKDTAGPAMNPLIKVMNLVSLLLAPVMIQPMSDAIRLAIVGACIVAIGIAVFLSKHGSIATELAMLEPEAESREKELDKLEPPALTRT